MKTYIGTKIVEARPMNRQEYNDYRGWTVPEDENPLDEGFLIQYPNGYISWSAANVFVEAYRSTDGLTFGAAIEALKAGHKVARAGWNGKGMFLYYVASSTVDKFNLRNEAKDALEDVEFEQGIVRISGHIDMKAADGSVIIGWLASQTDMLADDWTIIE